MPIRFDAAADRIVRASSPIDYNAAYTWMGWVYFTSLSGAPVIFVPSDSFYSNNADEIYISVGSGNKLTSFIGAGAAFDFAFGTVVSTATWYHIAGVRESATSYKIYLNGVLDTTNTFDITGRTACARMESGAWSTGNNDPLDGRIAYVKMWNAALTAAEVAQEVHTIRPHRAPWLWTPLFPGSGERVRDYSGNGRDWTEGGTLTDEDPPPVSWGGRSQVVGAATAAAAGYMTTMRGMWGT